MSVCIRIKLPTLLKEEIADKNCRSLKAIIMALMCMGKMAKDTNPPYKHNARFKNSLSSKSIKCQPVTWYGWATRVGWDRARMIIPCYNI